MGSSGDIEGEVTRNEAVRYLQGALGHAVVSTLFLLLGGLLSVVGYGTLAVVSIAVAFLISANGFSIWAWNRLRFHFAARTATPEETEPKRELTASPLSPESRVEMQAGAVMILVLVVLLVLGRFALQFLGAQTTGYVCIGLLSVGNITALVKALATSSPETTGQE
jgi:hypothetical protein